MSQTDTTQSHGVPNALTDAVVAQYHRDGFVQLSPDFLPAGTLGRIASAVPGILASDGPHRIMERDGKTIRSAYGPHQSDPVIADITALPELVAAVTRLIGDDVYVHQSKINLKAPFAGEQWEWHQDYINWLRIDGIPRPDLVNVAIFLDEVTEFNGPLTLIPGSHREGLLAGSDIDGMPSGYEDAPTWVATLTANEKYQLRPDVIERMASAGGMFSAKGLPGSVLFFHANVLHASAPNISPFGRSVLILVYNRVSNAPRPPGPPRPAFLAEPNVIPLPVAPASGKDQPDTTGPC